MTLRLLNSSRRALPSLAGLALIACGHTGSVDAPNVGPCPASISLIGAERLIEMRGTDEIYSNVGFTGEIIDVQGFCRYAGTDPIRMQLELSLAFGRGPAAEGEEQRRYGYFVSVIRADQAVIATQNFYVDAVFPPGQNSVELVEKIEGIIIPRLDSTISGSNFEVVIGFELTAQQLAFNQEGKRFRINADVR